jgi:hypothetical protein
MGLAWEDESLTGAAGTGLSGLACTEESVAGADWVFCAGAAAATERPRRRKTAKRQRVGTVSCRDWIDEVDGVVRGRNIRDRAIRG